MVEVSETNMFVKYQKKSRSQDHQRDDSSRNCFLVIYICHIYIINVNVVKYFTFDVRESGNTKITPQKKSSFLKYVNM